jgi:hypothetical protein
MATFEKVTSDANELVFGTLLEGYRRLTIPLFQRSYAWGGKEFERFKEDVSAVVLDDADTRFIGAIVAVERSFGPNFPVEYEIVDGQQRLITLYLTIAAAAFVVAKRGAPLDAAVLLRRYLYLPDLIGLPSNTKLSTSLDDTAEFSELWRRLLSIAPLSAALGDAKPRPPAAGGEQGRTKKILAQFERLRKWLDAVWKEGQQEAVNKYLTAATSNLSFVWLSLQDPSSAPRIFESLNNRGVRTTVGDLVRNEIFARLRETPEAARDLYGNEWQSFVQELQPRYEDFFFPYGLIVNRNTKKSELFTALRSRWKPESDAASIISHMQEYVPAYLAVSSGKAVELAPKDVQARIERFGRFRVPSAVYPFLMQLLHEGASEALQWNEVPTILDVVESFLVRRALCGFEPTGLHAVFKGLWHDIASAPSPEAVEAEIRKRKTVQWPDSEQLRQCVAQRPLYGSAMASYVIIEYDRSLGGDVPSEKPEIEHVLPQKLAKGWTTVFTQKEHETLKHVWANLVPITGMLNKTDPVAPYASKRAKFSKDSMYKTPRHVADAYTEWNPTVLAQRSKELGNFAVTRWKY